MDDFEDIFCFQPRSVSVFEYEAYLEDLLVQRVNIFKKRLKRLNKKAKMLQEKYEKMNQLNSLVEKKQKETKELIEDENNIFDEDFLNKVIFPFKESIYDFSDASAESIHNLEIAKTELERITQYLSTTMKLISDRLINNLESNLNCNNIKNKIEKYVKIGRKENDGNNVDLTLDSDFNNFVKNGNMFYSDQMEIRKEEFDEYKNQLTNQNLNQMTKFLYFLDINSSDIKNSDSNSK